MPLRVLLDRRVPMRDGVELALDAYLPGDGDRFPVLLCRTIYDRQAENYVGWAARFAAAGYAAAIQDCRGRYDSDGVWDPYICEAEDGHDTLEWIGAQPWCDGNIGTFGISYVGFTQLLPAPLGSRFLKAMLPIANQEDNFGHHWVDGVFQLENPVNFFRIGRRTMNLPGSELVDMDAVYRHLPLASALDHIADVPAYRTFLSHSTFDEYWKAQSMKGRYGAVAAPAFFVTGWYDNLLHEQFKLFRGFREEAATEEARSLTRMLVGPWTHGEIGARAVAGVDFGAGAEVDIVGLHLRWYDRRLRARETGIDAEAPLRLFVMGANVWRDEHEWPLARTRWTALHLRAGGALALEPPGDEPPDEFVYDPDDPVPTAGGQSMFLEQSGPRDRRALEARADVLVYTGDPLAEPLEVTGPVTLRLFAVSSAPDTDFTATLLDVHPDGRALSVCEGIVRARYRESLEEPSLIEPGEVYEYAVSLWETSHTFLPGHAIRLEVSSSNFPRFDRNPNTGAPIGTDARVEIARQQVLHDRAHASHLLLPVIPA